MSKDINNDNADEKGFYTWTKKSLSCLMCNFSTGQCSDHNMKHFDIFNENEHVRISEPCYSLSIIIKRKCEKYSSPDIFWTFKCWPSTIRMLLYLANIGKKNCNKFVARVSLGKDRRVHLFREQRIGNFHVRNVRQSSNKEYI